MQRGFSVMLLVFLVAILAIVGAGSFYLFNKQQLSVMNKFFPSEINSFEDCAKKYPVLESFPEQCNTPDGRHFAASLLNNTKTNLENSKCSQGIYFAKDIDKESCQEFHNSCEIPTGLILMSDCSKPEVFLDTEGWKEFILQGKFSIKYPEDKIKLIDYKDGVISLISKDTVSIHGFDDWITIVASFNGMHSKYETLIDFWAKDAAKRFEYKNVSKGVMGSVELDDLYKGEKYYSQTYYLKHSSGGMIEITFKDRVNGPKLYEKVLSTIDVF